MKSLNFDSGVNKYLSTGNNFYSQKDYKKAAYAFKQAVRSDPKNFVAWNNLGAVFYILKKTDEAEGAYQKALALKPTHAETYYNLGVLLKTQDRYRDAISCLKKATQFNPSHTSAHIALGQILMDLERMDEATDEYKIAIGLDPGVSEPHNQLGNVYRETGRLKDALISYQTAIAIDPKFTQAWANLAATHHVLGNLKQTEQSLKKAIATNPDTVNLYCLLADVFEDQGRSLETVDILKRAIEIDPSYVKPYDLLFEVLRKLCDWEEAKKIEKYLDKKGGENPFTSILKDENPAKNLASAKDWCVLMQKRLPHISFTFNQTRKRETHKIRVGYLSRDFRDHPVGHMIASMFHFHDRKKFEIYAFSYGKDDGSKYLKMIRGGVDKFIDISGNHNPQAARIINENDIDILIDLAGHTKDNRFEICAMMPAPVLVSWLGFPGTTGASFIDYIIVDKIIAPPEHQKYFSEKLVYLPRSYQVNNYKQTVSTKKYTRKDFLLPPKGVVFTSFNQYQKIDPVIWAVWMNILKRVPGSVLWLWDQNKEATNNLKAEAKRTGVDPARLVFSERIPKDRHLARLKLANIALDTNVYGGHTTTSDMLWAGLPVITRLGDHFASRVAASVLTDADLPELVVPTLKEYEDKAVALAKNKSELSKIKTRITHRNLTKKLYDTRGFVKDLEKAYEVMWERYKKNLKPAPIIVK